MYLQFTPVLFIVAESGESRDQERTKMVETIWTLNDVSQQRTLESVRFFHVASGLQQPSIILKQRIWEVSSWTTQSHDLWHIC